ncbi:MAG: hypothetical protein SFU55_11870 [Methylophilus sp.]|nr:hypothetical protein [Methylophilus sp.]
MQQSGYNNSFNHSIKIDSYLGAKMEFHGAVGIYTLIGVLAVIGAFLMYCVKKVK